MGAAAGELAMADRPQAECLSAGQGQGQAAWQAKAQPQNKISQRQAGGKPATVPADVGCGCHPGLHRQQVTVQPMIIPAPERQARALCSKGCRTEGSGCAAEPEYAYIICRPAWLDLQPSLLACPPCLPAHQ